MLGTRTHTHSQTGPSPGALARVLEERAAADGEVIFMLTDGHHVRLALNLLLNLEEHRLRHHLVIASSPDACESLWWRSRGLGLSVGCGYSSFLGRGRSAAMDAGLDAYALADDHIELRWLAALAASAHSTSPSHPCWPIQATAGG